VILLVQFVLQRLLVLLPTATNGRLMVYNRAVVINPLVVWFVCFTKR